MLWWRPSARRGRAKDPSGSPLHPTDDAGFFISFRGRRSMRRSALMRPAFWNGPTAGLARGHERHLRSSADIPPVRQRWVLNTCFDRLLSRTHGAEHCSHTHSLIREISRWAATASSSPARFMRARRWSSSFASGKQIFRAGVSRR
jgi:hypothetical protein